MEISNAMSRCFKNGIKVYPKKFDNGWKIQYVILKKVNTFNKILKTNKEINEAVVLSYEYLAKKYC